MQVARELRKADGLVDNNNRLPQKKESGGYFVEANHIEFKDVKVSVKEFGL